LCSPECSAYFRVEAEAFRVVVVSFDKPLVRGFFGEEAAGEVGFEAVEVGVPSGGPLGGGGAVVECVGEGEEAAVGVSLEFDPILAAGGGPGDEVWGGEFGDFSRLAAGFEKLTGFGLPPSGPPASLPGLFSHRSMIGSSGPVLM
jgi:hypothetical protein